MTATITETKPTIHGDTFGYEEAKQILTELVEEKGADYVYEFEEVCSYFVEGAPSCLVGHYLARKGFGPEDVIEGTAATGLYLLREAPDETLHLLGHAQRRQDEGDAWGVAVARAVKSLSVVAE